MARFRDGSPEFINRLKITFLLHNKHWTVVVVVLRMACNCLVMSFSQPCIIRGWWISALIRNRFTGHSNNKKFRGYNNIWSFCFVLFPWYWFFFFKEDVKRKTARQFILVFVSLSRICLIRKDLQYTWVRISCSWKLKKTFFPSIYILYLPSLFFFLKVYNK